MPTKRAQSVLGLLLVAVIWGAATPVIKFTLQGIDPVPFLTYRFFLSSLLAVAIILFYLQKKHLIRENFLQIIIYSLFSTTFALGLLFLGMDRTSVLDTVLITAVSPLVTAFFGVVFFKDVITKQEKLGILLAFIGTVITILEPVLTGQAKINQLSGNFLVFGYLVTNAYAAVVAKKLVQKGVSAFQLSNISFLIGFITLLPIALLHTSIPQMVSMITAMDIQYHLGVFYMAFLSGTIAYALWIKGQEHIEISEAGVFAYLSPIFAAPLAVLWLDEIVTIPFIIGAVVITIGVIIAESRRQ